ncbi:MAG TPA: hypothetical protein VG122_09940 [Gemmata sp.]|jgi:hypothetical protein|nr:hypothetical protein [Gemmata sp.]
MRNRKRLAILCCVLTIAIASAAIVYWPTPRRNAMARVAALDGTYREQTDEDGQRKVHCLILASRPIAEPDLIALRDLRPIHRLMLDGCPLKDAWLAHLAELEELELLTLTGCPVTDAGLIHLKTLKNLKNLSLRNTPVTDAGLVHLQSLTSLTFLNVSYSRVTEQGTAELRRTLPGLKRIYLRDEPDD